MYRKKIYSALPLFLLFFTLAFSQHVLAMPKAGSADGPISTGVVIETMNAANYTYMLIESESGQKWVAIPETTVQNGSTVNYVEGMVMKNFKSNTLNRTFDAVIFSSGLVNHGASSPVKALTDDSFASAVKAEKNSAGSAPPMELSAGSSGAIMPLEENSVEKSLADNGFSVEEIFNQAKQLAGKKVQLKGKVVKFSPNIMGRNWVHLQDGTGNPLKNTHDMVITTQETVKLHSIITMEGIVAANKDFGAGYKYTAILEKATVIK